MDFYHGTTVGGLDELRPSCSPYSNLKEPRVYLTTSKQLALHYIWDTERSAVKRPMLDIRRDGVLVFQEMFSGALEYFYRGLGGYIYRCVGDYPLNHEVGVFSCATSDKPVRVMDADYVDDVYEKIMEYQKYGTFIYERYEDLPRWRHDLIRGHVMRSIKDNNLLSNATHPDHMFLRERYPQYWREAEVLFANGLL